ncbi:sensor histidine kinase [Bacteroidota bacterium]
MEIRDRLTIYVTLIIAVILILAELSVYTFSEFKWKEDFNARLHNKASAVTKLLLDVEGVDADLIRLIEKNNFSTLPFEEVHLFDQSNKEVFSSVDTSILLITPMLVETIREKKEVETSQGDYKVVGFEYSGIYDRIVVVAGAKDIYGLQKLFNLRNILIIVFIISLFLAFLTARLFSKRALHPILKVIDEVPAITESTLHLRVNEGNGKDELARLAKTFNKMLERLENVFKVQQTFIANASHEIRTPLAHITGHLEVTLMKERTQETYVKMIRSVLDDILNLGNTANRLLLLTMASSESYKIPMDSLRVDDILWEAKAELNKTHPDYQVVVQFPDDFQQEIAPDHLFTIKGNDHLIRTVVLNLMENGCKYSGNHAVDVTIQHTNSEIQISFRDQGVGIPIEEQELIFEPFYRAKNVATIQGSGLGLSLVKRITQLHKGSTTMTSSPGSGSEFVLWLPIITD